MVLAAAAIALGGTGLGLQMKAAHEQGKQIEAQSKSEAAWQEYNAKLAEREATETQEAAAVEEKRQRKAGERLKARQRVQLGKIGVLPVGSAELVLKETVTELEEDALRIRRGGQVGAQRLTAEAMLSRLRGRAALFRGRAARRAARFGGAGEALRGGAQLAFKATK